LRIVVISGPQEIHENLLVKADHTLIQFFAGDTMILPVILTDIFYPLNS